MVSKLFSRLDQQDQNDREDGKTRKDAEDSVERLLSVVQDVETPLGSPIGFVT